DWDRVRNLHIDDLQREADEPSIIAAKVGMRAYFGDAHPYGRPVSGTEATVGKLTLDDIKACHAARFVPANARLLVAGDLKLQRPAGIHVAGFGGKGREARLRSLMPEDEPVRTIYLPVLRSMLPAMHELFDFPDPSQIKGQREVTTIASQSLFFMNNPLVEETARSAATRLLADEPKGDSARVRLAFLRVLAREPRPEETADALAFLQSLNPDGDTRYRWTAFVQSLLASAEFRYLH
ncbi:MAG: DUF1553 domain-containing protein, partial [Chthoniobacteraceae bacterium]